jgi:hypothetical protein
VLVRQFEKGDEKKREKIYDFYKNYKLKKIKKERYPKIYAWYKSDLE